MFRWFAIVLTCTFLLAAGIPRPASAADAPYDINVILSMSGPFAFVGTVDHEALVALETSVNKHGGIGGRPVHFIYNDDKTDPQTAIQLLNGIVANHPAIIIGSSSAASCQAMLPIVKAGGPVIYCLSPGLAPDRGSYAFSTSVSSTDAMLAAVRYLRLRGIRRLGSLSTADFSGQLGDKALALAMDLPENKNAGMTVVDSEHFAPGDLTVAAQLAKIKSANPQGLIFWTSGTAFATELHGAIDAGLDHLPIATSNANMNYAQMKQYASFMPKDVIFPGLGFLAGQASNAQQRDVQKNFADAFSAINVRPDFLHSTAWDPGMIAIDGLKSLGPNATADQVRAYINGLHGFNGISGVYDFRDGSQRGLSAQNVVLMHYDSTKDSWVAVSRPGGEPLR